jgi:hypothetical protein
MSENMLSEEVEPYDSNVNNEETVGGKRRRKPSSRRTRGRKVHHKKSMKKRGTKKRGHKKGPSKWIMHVKAFCKKTGKTFPEALKDPMCKKSFKH